MRRPIVEVGRDYLHEKLVSNYKKFVDPTSIRTKVQGPYRVRVGCPKGYFIKNVCKKGMIPISILHPNTMQNSLKLDMIQKYWASPEKAPLNVRKKIMRRKSMMRRFAGIGSMRGIGDINYFKAAMPILVGAGAGLALYYLLEKVIFKKPDVAGIGDLVQPGSSDQYYYPWQPTPVPGFLQSWPQDDAVNASGVPVPVNAIKGDVGGSGGPQVYSYDEMTGSEKQTLSGLNATKKKSKARLIKNKKNFGEFAIFDSVEERENTPVAEYSGEFAIFTDIEKRHRDARKPITRHELEEDDVMKKLMNEDEEYNDLNESFDPMAELGNDDEKLATPGMRAKDPQDSFEVEGGDLVKDAEALFTEE